MTRDPDWEPWPNSYSEGAYQRGLYRTEPNTTAQQPQSPGGALSEVRRSYSADNDHSKAVVAHETRQAPCCESTFCGE